jgi:hypothetical protein
MDRRIGVSREPVAQIALRDLEHDAQRLEVADDLRSSAEYFATGHAACSPMQDGAVCTLPHPAQPEGGTGRKMTADERRLAIRRILDARFSLSTFERMRQDAAHWNSPRNDMARGLYGEAIREMQRLETVPDDHLAAEIAAIASPLP